MRSFIFCVVGLLGSAVIAPTTCPADDFCCPPFPLPSKLEVGHHWTYLKTSVTDTNYGASNGLPEIEVKTDTLTVTVDRLHQIGDQTYFALSDGGLYRVDEAGRTWKYDTEAEKEIILWDNLWELGALADEVLLDREPEDRYLYYEDIGVEAVIANGYACPGPWIIRYGPVGLDELAWALPPIDWTSEGGWNESMWKETLRDWGVTYVYGFDLPSPENLQTMIIAPDVGVLHYSGGSWEWSRTYVLIPDKTKVTVVEDVSFGELKQRMTRPASNVP